MDQVVLGHAYQEDTRELLDDSRPAAGAREARGHAGEEPDRDQQGTHAEREDEQVEESECGAPGGRDPREHGRERRRPAGRGHQAGGGAQQKHRRIGPAAEATGPADQPLRRGDRQHVEHGQAEEQQQVGDGEAGPRVGRNSAEQRPGEAGQQAEHRVEQRQPGHVGQGQADQPPPRWRLPALPAITPP